MKTQLLNRLLLLVSILTLASCVADPFGNAYDYEGPPTRRTMRPPGWGYGNQGNQNPNHNGIRSVTPMECIPTESGPIYRGISPSGNLFYRGAPRNLGDPMKQDPYAPRVYMYY